MKMVDDPPNLFIIYVFRLIEPPKKIFGAGGFLGTPHPMGHKTPKDSFWGVLGPIGCGSSRPQNLFRRCGQTQIQISFTN